MPLGNQSGLGVNNWYGPRTSGGGAGPYESKNEISNYVVELPLTGLNAVWKFPEGNGVKVYEIDTTFVVGTISALAIGGLSVLAATAAAPVTIPQGNTGLVTQTGGTGGKLIIRYKNVSGDATH